MFKSGRAAVSVAGKMAAGGPVPRLFCFRLLLLFLEECLVVLRSDLAAHVGAGTNLVYHLPHQCQAYRVISSCVVNGIDEKQAPSFSGTFG